MRLIAIGNIVDEKNNSIGLRLLDIDTRTIKDVPIDNVVDVLNKGITTIENIGTKGEELIGTNGSIDRLTKIRNGKVYGKSSLVIVDEIEDKGYNVADYKGVIKKLTTENVLGYANVNGIANGKLVEKDGNKFISSISGSYNKVKIQQKVSRGTKNKEKYTGEYIDSMESIKPIFNDSLVLDFCNGQFVVSDIDSPILNYSSEITKDIVMNNGVEEINGKYTLCGTVHRTIEWEDIKNKCIPDLRRIVMNRDAINKIKSFVVGRYNNLYLNYTIDEIQSQREFISDKDVNDMIEILKSLESSIMERIHGNKNKKIALVRSINGKGINYRIYLNNSCDHKSNIKAERLENIYRDKNEYANVWEEGEYFYVRGLDGVYKYNMNKIAEDYGRMEQLSKKNIKAKILNKNYTESVTSNGELTKLETEDELITIPLNVKSILKESIIFNEYNKKIHFTENIVKCAVKFKRKPEGCCDSSTLLERITISCRTEAAVNILNGFADNNLMGGGTKIEFARDIQPLEYAILMKEYYIRNKNIIIPNDSLIDGKFLLEALQEHINLLNASKILSRPMEIKPVYTKKLKQLSRFKGDKEYNVLRANVGQLRKYLVLATQLNVDTNTVNIIRNNIQSIQDILESRKIEYEKAIEDFKKEYETYYQ